MSFNADSSSLLEQYLQAEQEGRASTFEKQLSIEQRAELGIQKLSVCKKLIVEIDNFWK
tara:strand:- start:108 stop:284 length:177 start_codon:yes stop_codon:yes gene_type:complete